MAKKLQVSINKKPGFTKYKIIGAVSGSNGTSVEVETGIEKSEWRDIVTLPEELINHNTGTLKKNAKLWIEEPKPMHIGLTCPICLRHEIEEHPEVDDYGRYVCGNCGAEFAVAQAGEYYEKAEIVDYDEGIDRIVDSIADPDETEWKKLVEQAQNRAEEQNTPVQGGGD